jgi:Zn-dependent protease/predicted transcriptional regulator
VHAHIKLGRILGVQVGLHYSWFIIAALITFSLAARFGATNPRWGGALVWGAASVAALAFFASLLVHELSHAAVARARGVPVKGITLFALGGVAQIEKDTGDPKTEFWMGLAGPAMSALIGAVCLGLARVTGWEAATDPATPLPAMWMWLGYINLVLAAFNLIPGFPLDGGRILRAAVWWRTGDRLRATRVAASAGTAVAFGLIFYGVWQAFGGAGFGGLWLAVIGWFLLEASRASYAQAAAGDLLRDLRVRDLMSEECGRVDRHVRLRDFVDDYLLRTGRRCFFVQEDGHLRGLVTPHEVKAVDKERWPALTVADVMRPVGDVQSLDPDAPASDALEMLARANVNQVPVVEDGRLQGSVTRGHVLEVLRTRAELSM